jgi:hypothetical protein
MKLSPAEKTSRALAMLLRSVGWSEDEVRDVRDRARLDGVLHVDVAFGPQRASVTRRFPRRERAR